MAQGRQEFLNDCANGGHALNVKRSINQSSAGSTASAESQLSSLLAAPWWLKLPQSLTVAGLGLYRCTPTTAPQVASIPILKSLFLPQCLCSLYHLPQPNSMQHPSQTLYLYLQLLPFPKQAHLSLLGGKPSLPSKPICHLSQKFTTQKFQSILRWKGPQQRPLRVESQENQCKE